MVKIYPLVMLTIHQPHFLATCTNSSQKMEVSCFDASTHLSPHNYFITCGGHRVPLPLDYQHPVFQTKPGEPDKKSGVPPALLTFTVLDIFTQAVKLDLSLGRPLKLNLGTSLYNQLADVASTLKESLCLDDIMKLVDVDSAHSDIKEDSNCGDSS